MGNNIASLKIIKDELSRMSHKELTGVISSLLKFRKENKEFVTYLLFDSKDEAEFIKSIKAEMDAAMEPVTRYNVRPMIKLIRKTLRNTRKAIKFSSEKETSIQLLMHFCSIIKAKNLPVTRFKSLNLMWDRCILNINKDILSLHEDLRYDYGVELKALIEEL